MQYYGGVHPTATADAPRLSTRQVVVSFSGLMLGLLLASIDQTIVATALPTIVGDLGGLDHLAWVVTAYLLAETVSTPPPRPSRSSGRWAARSASRCSAPCSPPGSPTCSGAPRPGA
jgi:MFS family permease